MAKELTTTENWDEFLVNLNRITGHNNLPVMPILKFDAGKGMWMEQTDKQDEDGKPLYKEIADKITFHIILSRKMLTSKFGDDNKYFTKEFQDNYVELFDQDRNVVFKGFYNQLKNDALYSQLTYFHVLYAYYNDKPYRIRLSGSKLVNLFPYLATFKTDNPAMFETIASKGQKLNKGAVDFYELKFKRGEAIEQQTIINRVNAVNEYLQTYYSQADQGGDNYEQPAIEGEKVIDVEEIPMA